MLIRVEKPGDWPGIERVVTAAFGQPDEADLIRRLREDGDEAASIVAVEQSNILGHVGLSWLKIETKDRPVSALSLAPLAVRPDYQRRGIGLHLVRGAIAQGYDLDADVIFVLGYPDYYRRFGFRSELAAKIGNPFRREAFMAFELTADVLDGLVGEVRFPPAFGID